MTPGCGARGVFLPRVGPLRRRLSGVRCCGGSARQYYDVLANPELTETCLRRTRLDRLAHGHVATVCQACNAACTCKMALVWIWPISCIVSSSSSYRVRTPSSCQGSASLPSATCRLSSPTLSLGVPFFRTFLLIIARTMPLICVASTKERRRMRGWPRRVERDGPEIGTPPAP